MQYGAYPIAQQPIAGQQVSAGGATLYKVVAEAVQAAESVSRAAGKLIAEVMQIAERAALVIAPHEVTTNWSVPSTSVPCNKPANVVTGNLLVAVIGYVGNHDATWPSGWVEDVFYYDSADNWTAATGHLIAGGSEPASYTWTCPGAFGDVSITRCDGNATTNPVGSVLVSTYQGGTDTSYTFDTITTGTANELIIYNFQCLYGGTLTWPVVTALATSPPAESMSYAYEVQAAAGLSTARVVNISPTLAHRLGVIVSYKSAGNTGVVKWLGLRRFLNEAVQVSETAVKFMVSTGAMLYKVVADAVQVAEALIRAMSMSRLVAEGAQVSEASYRARGMGRSLVEAVQAAEASMRTLVLPRSVGETVQVAEVTLRLRSMLRAVVEAVQAIESSVVVRALLRTIAEAVQAAESASVVRTLARMVTETVQIAEAAVNTLVSAGVMMYKAVAEVIQAAEVTVRALTMPRLVAEGIQISESAQRSRALARLVAETVQVQELVARWFTRLVAEVAQVSEVLSSMLQRLLAKVVNETIQVAEACTRWLSLMRAFVEGVQVAEAVRWSRTMSRLVAEAVQAGESVLRNMVMPRLVNEGVQAAEAVTRLVSRFLYQAIAEAMQIAEAARRSLTMPRTVAESIQAAEASMIRAAWRRLVSEAVQVSEDGAGGPGSGGGLVVGRVMKRLVAEVIQAVESIGLIKPIIRIVNEMILVSESILSTVIRTVIESVLKVRNRIFYMRGGW
jgi:hypothetical protein